eukprot:gene3446-6849_t
MRQKITAARAKSHSEGRGKRVKHHASRRVVLVCKNDSLICPLFKKASAVLPPNNPAVSDDSDKAWRRKRGIRRPEIKKSGMDPKRRVHQFLNRPSAPHNTNSVIMDAHSSPDRINENYDSFVKFLDEDVNFYGSFLHRESEEELSTSEDELTDHELQGTVLKGNADENDVSRPEVLLSGNWIAPIHWGDVIVKEKDRRLYRAAEEPDEEKS